MVSVVNFMHRTHVHVHNVIELHICCNCNAYIYMGMSEQALGWFPVGSGLAMISGKLIHLLELQLTHTTIAHKHTPYSPHNYHFDLLGGGSSLALLLWLDIAGASV